MNNKYLIFLALVSLLVLFYLLYSSNSENFSFNGSAANFKNILVSDEKGNISILNRDDAQKQLTDFENRINGEITKTNNEVATVYQKARAGDTHTRQWVTDSVRRLEGVDATKANASTVYTKDEVNNKVYTKAEVNYKLSKKQNTGSYLVRGGQYYLNQIGNGGGRLNQQGWHGNARFYTTNTGGQKWSFT